MKFRTILNKAKSVYFVVLGEHARSGSNALSMVNGRFGACQEISPTSKALFTKFFNTIGNINLAQARVSECVFANPLQ